MHFGSVCTQKYKKRPDLRLLMCKAGIRMRIDAPVVTIFYTPADHVTQPYGPPNPK